MKEMQTNGLTLEQELERYKSWLEDLHIRYDELKKEHSETKKELETVSKKSVEQCYKDSKLIGLLETKNIQLEIEHEELKRLQKKEVEMKPIVDNGQPYCPVCKTDLYHGGGIMDKYTDYYCSKCGQKLDWGEET